MSKSARVLSKYLGIKRIKVSGSKFRGKNRDTIINWGKGKGNIGNARQINKLSSIEIAANKLSTLEALQAHQIAHPRFSTSLLDFSPSDLLYGRCDLYGHSGRGIVVDTQQNLYYNEVDCPLYVEAINKVTEYRVIVVGSNVVDLKQKKKKNGVEHNENIWNHSGGYIFARNDITIPDGLKQLGIDAVDALGLDFGAVDIIEDTQGKLYVLEVNTAFGLEGQTIELVGDAIRRLL